jgi:uncharacterized membrane protein YvbJ
MFCSKCGNEIAEGSKFCNKCGTPVAMEGVSEFDSLVKKSINQYGKIDYDFLDGLQKSQKLEKRMEEMGR